MAPEEDMEPQDKELLSRQQMLAVLTKFGPYQRRLLLLLIIPLIADGYGTLSAVLTFSSPAHRCQVPGLANDTFAIQNDAHRMMVNLSIPLTSSGGDVTYSQCDVYKERNGSYVNKTQQEDTEPCHSWVYDDTDFKVTVVTQFDLVCEHKGFRANFHMVYLVGMLAGSLFSGYVCDRFGRKTVFLIGTVMSTIINIVMAFPRVTPVLLVFRFMDAIFGMATYMALYVLCLELMGPDRRTLAGSLMMVLYVLGTVTVGFVSYFVNDWRFLQAINALPFAISISYFWLIDESPRWLLTKGHTKKARNVILKVMKFNKIDLSADILLDKESLRLDNIPEHKEQAAVSPDTKEAKNGDGMVSRKNDGNAQGLTEHEDKGDTQKTGNGDTENTVDTETKEKTAHESILRLFKHPSLIARTAIIFFNWSAVSTTYYGLSLNVGNLTGNIRLNFLMSALVELVGYGLAWLLLDRLGRRRTHCAAILLSGTSCIATIFPVLLAGADLQWVTIALVMMGKMGISAAFSAVYLMSGELFPTVIRNQGMGYSSTVARVATAVSPYIADLSLHIEGSVGKALPLVIFGAMALSAGLLALCLPETLHRKLPDTILEAANFTRRHSDDSRHVREEDKEIKEKTDEVKYTEISAVQI